MSSVADVTPAVLVNVALPSSSPPARNVTEPVGSEPDDGVTVAVNCTSCPKTAVGSEPVTATVVAAGGAPPTRRTSPGWE